MQWVKPRVRQATPVGGEAEGEAERHLSAGKRTESAKSHQEDEAGPGRVDELFLPRTGTQRFRETR